jgi:hypothetical protein
MKNNILKPVFGLALLVLIFSSCAEQRYYKHNNNRHSREYYERRHEPVPVGIEFRIHN